MKIIITTGHAGINFSIDFCNFDSLSTNTSIDNTAIITIAFGIMSACCWWMTVSSLNRDRDDIQANTTSYGISHSKWKNHILFFMTCCLLVLCRERIVEGTKAC